MPLNVSESEKSELLVTFAALILHDDKVEINEENISKLIAAAGATVEPYWPKLFAGLLEGRDVGALLVASGPSASAPAAAAPAAAAAGGKGAPAKKEEPKKKEKSEESGGDMGFSLFD